MTFDDICPNMIKCPYEMPWADHFLGQSVNVSAFDEIGVVGLDLNKFPVEIFLRKIRSSLCGKNKSG